MTDTDVFGFSSLKLFDSIKSDQLPDTAREICDVFEDLIFVWDYKESNLRVINWRATQSKDNKNVQHQVSGPSPGTSSSNNLILDSNSIVNTKFHNFQNQRLSWRHLHLAQRHPGRFDHGAASALGIQRRLSGW